MEFNTMINTSKCKVLHIGIAVISCFSMNWMVMSWQVVKEKIWVS